MTTTIETNKVLVLDTSESGVKLAVNGENTWLAWDALWSACGQDDAELAAAYQAIYRRARAKAEFAPAVVAVHQDHTNVWWVVSVTSAHGGGEVNYPRRRDEGGTHPNHMLAACEAEDICQRLGSRVARRVGFDGPAAKEHARKICAGVK